MTETAIHIENLTKEYRLGAIGGTTVREEVHRLGQRWFHREKPDDDYGKKFLALQGINLTVQKGERLGIIGRNGAGKSTLLKLLSRITAPTSGTISYNGRISSMLEIGTGFHRELTGRENIYMNGAILGMTKREIDQKMDAIIDFSEVGDFIDTPVKRYSSGMYVKLGFAVAAHLDNDILIVDEVLAVGDLAFQQKCLGKMGEASQQEGKTILYVSHNMRTIRQLCDRCILLDQGKIIFDGDVEEAIRMYSERGLQNQPSFMDFTSIKRPARYTQAIQMVDLTFLNQCNTPTNADSSAITFDLRLNVTVPSKNVVFRLVVQNNEGDPIGMSLSPETDFLTTGLQTIRIRFDTSLLVPGFYKLRGVLYQNAYWTLNLIDSLPLIGAFEKPETAADLAAKTNRKFHGNINFGKLSFQPLGNVSG